VDAVLERVFRGEFREGDRLTEQSLTVGLGMSRTPVREALIELEGLGVLKLSPNRGAEVSRFGEEKLREIYEVRRLLEVEATRRASGRMGALELGELVALTGELLESGGDDVDWVLDRRIHAAIAGSCGNRRLAYEIGRYAILVQAVRQSVAQRMKVQRVTSEQHLAVLTALAEGRADDAAEAMRLHLMQAEESAVLAVG
jgi:DNA-binding GntR family transcriptional regulator